MKASNALLNYHKTIATSLSGKPFATWQALLNTHGITTWHDRTSSSPLTYFDYVLYALVSLNGMWLSRNYMIPSAMLLTFIHNAMYPSVAEPPFSIHSFILNYDTFCVSQSLPKPNYSLSLRGPGTSFINFRIFPRLSFDILSTSFQWRCGSSGSTETTTSSTVVLGVPAPPSLPRFSSCCQILLSNLFSFLVLPFLSYLQMPDMVPSATITPSVLSQSTH